MSHIPSPTSSFYALLQQFDLDTIQRLQRLGCRACGGALDRADYSRKYRGGAADGEANDFGRRFSLCCRSEGCRRRLSPDSVRFLGRKVYLAFVVVVASSMARHQTVARLAESSGISRQTLSRWLTFWRLKVPRSTPWKAAKALFVSPLARDDLPGELRRVFDCASFDGGGWVFLLRLIAPLGKVT